MGEFVCKVADATGKVFSQVEAAQSVAEARQKLADRGLYVYSVRQRGGLLPQWLVRRRERVVGGSDFLIFNQQFNTLIRAGLPILKALDLLAERAASPRLRPLLMDVRQRVREGASLSEALEQQAAFPKVYCTSVLAGEKSGNLVGVLDYYIAYQRVSTGFRRRLLASLVYPVILIIFATVVVLYLVSYVIPKFARLYSELSIELPAPTRLLTALALDYRGYVVTVAGLVALSLVALFLWSRSEAGGRAVDRFKLRLPIFGEAWIKFHVAQLSRTLSTLLAGGTPLVAALETSAGAVGTRLVAEAVSHAASRVREGQSLHASLAETNLMPDVALEMVEVGEATGALAPMLQSVAEFYEEEVNLRLQTLVALINPIILLFMALVIAFILISLYLPIFSFSLGGIPR